MYLQKRKNYVPDSWEPLNARGHSCTAQVAQPIATPLRKVNFRWGA